MRRRTSLVSFSITRESLGRHPIRLTSVIEVRLLALIEEVRDAWVDSVCTLVGCLLIDNFGRVLSDLNRLRAMDWCEVTPSTSVCWLLWHKSGSTIAVELELKYSRPILF